MKRSSAEIPKVQRQGVPDKQLHQQRKERRRSKKLGTSYSAIENIWYFGRLNIRLAPSPSRRDSRQCRIVGMNSDSNVWPRICRPGRETCTLPVLMNN